MAAKEERHAAKRREWEARIKECRESGETVAKWCRARKISTTMFYQWEREIYGGRPAKKAKGGGRDGGTGVEFEEMPKGTWESGAEELIIAIRKGTVLVEIYAGAGEREIEALLRGMKLC